MSATNAFINEPCPWLPSIDRVWTSADVRDLGKLRDPVAFFDASLHYAQSQWQTGFPAQALLQINHALSCPLPTADLPAPLPYRALAWILTQRREGQFLGNPTRHFQHLATRMVEPNRNLRVWRAWACWYLSRAILPWAEFPGDARQIRKEHLIEPSFREIESELQKASSADDVMVWKTVLSEFTQTLPASASASLEVEILPADRLVEIHDLAHDIWPKVYATLLSPEQIRYMLDWMYAPEKLQTDFEQYGVKYALLKSDDQTIGFMGYSPGHEVTELHKLYLTPQQHGAGLGRQALEWLQQRSPVIRLRVNKHNAPAIRCYLRAGFTFEEDVVVDIGGGFVMDDYVMKWEATVRQPGP